MTAGVLPMKLLIIAGLSEDDEISLVLFFSAVTRQHSLHVVLCQPRVVFYF